MSFHPVIVIETVEEERVQRLIGKATGELQVMAFDWSVAQGLSRLQGKSSHWNNEYAPPRNARQAIEKTNDSAGYVTSYSRHANEGHLLA